MLTAYIIAAMKKAHYEILPDNEGYFVLLQGTPYLIIDTIKYGWINWCELINAFLVVYVLLYPTFSRIKVF